jgi:hypothetical protein
MTSEAKRKARLRRLAAKDGERFVKLRGENPQGDYGRARYMLTDPHTNSFLAEWQSLEEAGAAFAWWMLPKQVG